MPAKACMAAGWARPRSRPGVCLFLHVNNKCVRAYKTKTARADLISLFDTSLHERCARVARVAHALSPTTQRSSYKEIDVERNLVKAESTVAAK